MSKYKNAQVSEFSLSGQFLGFIVEDGYKIKGLRLATGDGESYIKLEKSIRGSLSQVLMPGDWLEVSGDRIIDWKKSQVKLKAYEVKHTVKSNAGIAAPVATKQAK